MITDTQTIRLACAGDDRAMRTLYNGQLTTKH